MSNESKTIDLVRVQKALCELDSLAKQHPELLATSFEQSELQDQWELYLAKAEHKDPKHNDIHPKRGRKATGGTPGNSTTRIT